MILVSNGLWAMAIELGVMMLFRRTRRFAAIGAILAVVFIQLIGRQPMYALLLAQLFLLCIPGQWNRRLAWFFVAAYAAVLLALLGVFPDDLVLRGKRL
jgi:hypothetical protein